MAGFKTRIIVNPKADMGHTGSLIAELKPMVDRYAEADWSETGYPTHATELARQAGELGYKLVIAIGGDGTVHEVVNGLMQVSPENRPRLGILPVGSGNDFAQSIGITGTPADALDKIFSGQPKQMDVGLYDIGDGERKYFNNTFGIGFDGTVNTRTHRIKVLRGFLMYLVAVLQTIILNHDSPRMHITTDMEAWDEQTTMFTVCNGPREGGGFLVAPQADSSDGILNYATVCKVSRLMMLRLIPEVMKGTHGRFKQVRLGELHKLQIHSEKPVQIHTDGETIAGFGTEVRNVTIEVVPGAVVVMV